jgi:sugar/nucleoside kinase (ribokinase family)
MPGYPLRFPTQPAGAFVTPTHSTPNRPPQDQLDIVAIGNAIVDVLAKADDDFLENEGLLKGGMQLIDAKQAESLYSRMGPGREISGGSAANTLAGAAALGCRCAFVGQVADDQLGAVFAHDIRANGVHFDTAARGGEPPTARCLILVSPDGERTMNTFLGASHYLPMASIGGGLIERARVLYLEGYMWDPAEPREVMREAIRIARATGNTVAMTLSVNFIIELHRSDLQALIDGGLIDILFVNDEEVKCLVQNDDLEAAIAEVAPLVPLLVVTMGASGAAAFTGGERFTVAAEPVARVVDTTGAGDLFAAGFLAGHVKGRSVEDCLRMGAIAAAEVISHYGARPEEDLMALVNQALG